MKLIQLKCPSCDAKLQVSDQLKKFTCNYCGVSTLLDEEIIKVEHHINNVNKDELYKKADAYIKLGEFKEAKKICEEMLEKYFYDSQSWIYAIAIITENYNKNIISNYEKVLEYLNNYKKLETDTYKKTIYVNKVEKYISECKEKYSTLINEKIECPFCGENINFGQKKCNCCEEDLFWPNDDFFNI